MRKYHSILTPENVLIRFELAGLGSRFAATLIDTLVQAVLILLVLLAVGLLGVDLNGITSLKSVFIGLGLIALFFIMFGYFIFFEMIMSGQSPGKKVIGLKVMKFNGEPLKFIDSCIRNVIRIVDMLPPPLYLVGSIYLIFTKDYRRIGDFAANTVVIKVRRITEPIAGNLVFEKQYDMNSMEPAINHFPVTNLEYEVLRDFLQRKDRLGERKRVFTYHLNSYFMTKFHLEKPLYTDPLAFFEAIIGMNSDQP